MGSLTNTYENLVLNYIFNHTGTIQNAAVYLALGTTALTDDSSTFTEVNAGGYIRKACTFGTAAASRSISNTSAVQYDQATADWGTIRSWMLYTAESAGTAIAWGSLTADKTVNNGNTPSVASGEVTISLTTSNGCSTYLANVLLDTIFRNQVFTAPDTYLGLWTSVLDDASTGSTAGEVSGGNYSRVQVNTDGATSPFWTTASTGTLENSGVITFPTPSASWGTVESMGICDAASTGNLLFYDTSISDSPASGDTVQYANGALDVSLT